MVIACRGFHFENAVAEREDGNIERAATEIVNKDGRILFLVDTICKGTRGRLIDDTHDLKSCDLAGILGCWRWASLK